MAIWLICEALKNESKNGLPLTGDHEVLYMAPTFQQAHNMFWPKLKRLAEPITAKTMENTGILYLTNGRRIRLVGMDNPDAARGATASAVGCDEYADMPERAWDEVAQPMLMIAEGSALFIGTPKGRNHFYELYMQAEADESGDWCAFTFTSEANPFLTSREFSRMTRDMSSDRRRQEIEASFVASEGKVFKREWFKTADEPSDGIWHVAVDLAGFTPDEKNKKDMRRRDETAIALVKSHQGGWWVKEIIHGQWDTRETAVRILLAAKDVQASSVGIEKGALMNAVMPYMNDVMRQYGRYLSLQPLTHGNKEKHNRITWALQGRLEKGRVTFKADGQWLERLMDQAMTFPDKRAKDDLLDALAYIDQLDKGYFYHDFDASAQWRPADVIAGY